MVHPTPSRSTYLQNLFSGATFLAPFTPAALAPALASMLGSPRAARYGFGPDGTNAAAADKGNADADEYNADGIPPAPAPAPAPTNREGDPSSATKPGGGAGAGLGSVFPGKRGADALMMLLLLMPDKDGGLAAPALLLLLRLAPPTPPPPDRDAAAAALRVAAASPDGNGFVSPELIKSSPTTAVVAAPAPPSRLPTSEGVVGTGFGINPLPAAPTAAAAAATATAAAAAAVAALGVGGLRFRLFMNQFEILKSSQKKDPAILAMAMSSGKALFRKATSSSRFCEALNVNRLGFFAKLVLSLVLSLALVLVLPVD